MSNTIFYAKHVNSPVVKERIQSDACFAPWMNYSRGVKGYPYVDFFILNNNNRFNEDDILSYFLAASQFPPCRTAFQSVPLLFNSMEKVTYQKKIDKFIHAARVSTKFHVNKVCLALSPLRNLGERPEVMKAFLDLCSLGGRPEMVVHLCQDLTRDRMNPEGWQFHLLHGHNIGKPHKWTRKHVLRLANGSLNQTHAKERGYFLSYQTGKDSNTLFNGKGYNSLSDIVDGGDGDIMSEMELKKLMDSLRGEYIQKPPKFNPTPYGGVYSDEQIRDFLKKQGWANE